MVDYKAAGVDVEAGYKAVELMKKHVNSTLRPEVLGGLGGFSGAFSLKAAQKMQSPVLVSATDGVGTKLKLAFIMDKHDSVGIDCVAMCVNDLICSGGEPLFFLDYIACGRNIPAKIAAIVSGMASGCRMAGAALVGGETAEHPGLMAEDEYDLAGFAVGLVEEAQLINGSGIRPGDALVGIASSGVHSNGFSLLRRIFAIDETVLAAHHDCLGRSLGEELLEPTKIYVKALKSVHDSGVIIKGASHITGGGFYENIPRMLPDNIAAVIEKKSYPIPPIFGLIQQTGQLSEQTMYGTFNMGLGMVLAVAAEDAEKTVAAIGAAGERAYIVGQIKNDTDVNKAAGEDKLCLR